VADVDLYSLESRLTLYKCGALACGFHITADCCAIEFYNPAALLF